MANELEHFGIPGMKWGHRKARVSSGGSGGRKGNSLFGKEKRTAVKKFLFGDPDMFLKTNPLLNKKYASMNPQEKERARKVVQAGIYAVSALTAVELVQLYRLNKRLG